MLLLTLLPQLHTAFKRQRRFECGTNPAKMHLLIATSRCASLQRRRGPLLSPGLAAATVTVTVSSTDACPLTT